MTARAWPSQHTHEPTAPVDPGPTTPPPPRALTAQERRAASLTVATYSTSPDDCRELLSMLGLLDPTTAQERRRG